MANGALSAFVIGELTNEKSPKILQTYTTCILMNSDLVAMTEG
jgi:hypothetical protein